MVTDRPQFDILASMRPAPERRPSEAERLADTLRREIAALDKRIASLCLQVDWLSQRNSEAVRLCCEARKVVIDKNWQSKLEDLFRRIREGRTVERQAVESRSNEAEKVRKELAEIEKTVRGLRDRVASLEMQVDAIIALVQP